ncbi:MAG: DUF3179 domain-containing (seleno)protein [Planctomycetota bacterium]
MTDAAPPSEPSQVDGKPTVLHVPPRAWLLLLALVALAISGLWLLDVSPTWGDNGFPTESPDLDARWLVRAGERDLVPSLDDAPLLDVNEAQALKLGRKPMLFPTDRVLGVDLDGQQVCVPLRALNWHEVVNLTLGQRALALTFSPLADAPRGYLRGELSLGHSGLLYASTPLLYDRGPTPSLWSQIDGLARSGPRREQRLESIPVEIAQWGDWVARFPETRVVRPAVDERGKFYQRNSYGPYLRSDELRFPAPEVPGLAPKQRVLVVEAGGVRRVYPQARVLAQLDLEGLEPGKLHELRWTTEQGGQPVTFVVHPDPSEADPACVRVEPPARLVSEGLWFAVRGFDPELELAAE